MARPSSPSYSDQNSTVRHLKLLVLLLVLSNIGLGGFSFYLLRALDRNYSELIERSVPHLSNLQTLTAQAIKAMRATNTAALDSAQAVPLAMPEQGRAGFAADRALREKMLKANWLAGGEKERAEFSAAGEAFTRAGNDVVAALAAGRLTEATKMREERLRAAFERYVLATTKLSDVVESVSEQQSGAVSARTGSISTVVLGIASWPVVLLAALLALTAIFVLVLMVLFRGREMSDMP